MEWISEGVIPLCQSAEPGLHLESGVAPQSLPPSSWTPLLSYRKKLGEKKIEGRRGLSTSGSSDLCLLWFPALLSTPFCETRSFVCLGAKPMNLMNNDGGVTTAGRATVDILQRKIISIPVSPCKKLRSKIYLWLRETVLWFWIVPLCLESVLTIWSPGGSDWLVCKGLSSCLYSSPSIPSRRADPGKGVLCWDGIMSSSSQFAVKNLRHKWGCGCFASHTDLALTMLSVTAIVWGDASHCVSHGGSGPGYTNFQLRLFFHSHDVEKSSHGRELAVGC